MATRINTKFLVILSSSVLAVGGVLGGLWHLYSRGDVERLIATGDEMAAQGEYASAAGYYSRAVGRAAGDLETLRKLEDAVLSIRPETSDEARRAYLQWRGVLAHEVRHWPANPDAHLRQIREQHRLARLLGLDETGAARPHWQHLAEMAETMLRQVPATSEQHAHGRLYRGIARLRVAGTLREAALEAAEDDLVKFLEANPGHDLGWASLAEGRRRMAEALRAQNPTRAAEMARKAAETFGEAREAVPEGPEVAHAYVRHLIRKRRANPASVEIVEVADALDHMLEQIRTVDDPWLPLEAADALLISGVDGSIDRAERLVTEHLDEHPDALVHRLFLAQLSYRRGNFDSAAEHAHTVLQSEPLSVSLISQLQLMLRQHAAGLLVDIEHQRVLADGSGVDSPAFERLLEARQGLARLVADPETDARLIRADAKIAMVRENWNAAASGFESLIRDGTTSAEVFAFAAVCLEQLGQVGVAHERVVSALETGRLAEAPLLYRKGRLEFVMGRLEAAAETIDRLLQIAPEHHSGMQLARAISAREAAVDAAGAEADPVLIAIEDAQRFLQDGDADSARVALHGAMGEADSPQSQDLRLLEAAARLEFAAGHPEDARQYVERGLSIQPNHRRLRQFQALLEAGDPIEAAKRFAQSEHEDEAEQTVLLLLSLRTMAQQHRAMAEVQEAGGQFLAAEEALDLARRAEAEAEVQMEKAREVAADHPQVIELQFNLAVQAEDWEEASRLASRARDVDADGLRGLLFRGRLALERGRPAQAVRHFQQATDLQGHSSLAWRGLGLAQQSVGNFREARRALDRAYQNNPNDLHTIRALLAVLVQMQENTRALSVAQAARRLAPNDPEIREAWLDLEAEAGDRGLAMRRRAERYESHPGDRANASRLVVLLARTDPTSDMVRNPDGSRMYTESRWMRVSVQEQRRILRQTRRQWHERAERIVEELHAREGEDLTLARLRATVLHAQGDARAGEEALRTFVDRYLDSAADPEKIEMLLTLAQYQAEVGRAVEALATMQRAAPYQDAEALEVDQAIGEFYLGRHRYAEAQPYLQRVLEVNPTRAVALKVAECALHLGQLDEAESQLRQVVEAGGVDHTAALLQALLAHGQARALEDAGRRTEATRKREEYREALATAERLIPTDPKPHILRAQTALQEYRHTRSRGLVEAAIRALDQAESLRPGDMQIAFVRAEVLHASGDTRGAVGELARLLSRNPEHVRTRQSLVQLHLETGDRQAAIALLEEAIERMPTMAHWHELLASIHLQHTHDRAAAAESLRRAWELSGTAAVLSRYVNALLTQERPDAQTVLAILRGQQQMVRDEPILGAQRAHALYLAGRESEGRRALEQSYQRQRALVEAGERSLPEMSTWHAAASPLMRVMHPAAAERLIAELAEAAGGAGGAGGQPGPYDLHWAARYWVASGPDGLSRATELLTLAVERTPEENASLRVTLGFELGALYYQAEQYPAAADAYRSVLQIRPEHTIALNNLAFIKAEYLGQAEAALPIARRAQELAPADANVLDTLGWVYFKVGQQSDAERWLRESLKIDETAAANLHLAHLMIARGQSDRANDYLRRAAGLTTDSRMQAQIDRLSDDIRTGRTDLR